MNDQQRISRCPETGAILIQVAIALLALLALSAFVVDYGVMWTSRGQAQTSADAGALAGAISLAFADSDDFAAAREKARAVALQNGVWGEAPDVQLSDVTFLTPAVCQPPAYPGVADTCVKVDVFRNQRAGGSPLPTYFASLVGITNQGVRATATAQVITAGVTRCLMPWAVVDRWDEWEGTPDGAGPGGHDYPSPDPDYAWDSTFDKYSDGQGNRPPQENDHYVPASGSSDGTGYTLADKGRLFGIKIDSNTNATMSPGWFRAIRVPRIDGDTGGSVYRDNINDPDCSKKLPATIADPSVPCPSSIPNGDEGFWAMRGCFGVEPGNKVGPTDQGITDLIGSNTDQWIGGVGGYMANAAGQPIQDSPRLQPVGIFDIDNFLAQDPTGANGVVRLVKIIGFFIEGMGDIDGSGNITCCSPGGKVVVGRLAKKVGTGSSTLTTTSSFLNRVILVR